jgi:16S rRNA (cytosine1402-N4)-methyltransferase
MDAHQPVMLPQVLAGLVPRAGGLYVDATFGRGGHAGAILDAAPGLRLHAFDRDPDAVAHARQAFAGRPGFTMHHANFDAMGEILTAAGLSGQVDGVLMDLGVSSPQLDDPQRGFSFLRDGPLDMRMDPTRGEPVSDWLARASADEIADVLYLYGEERASRRIARAIVHDRVAEPFTRTVQLAEMIARVMGGARGRIHPATRSFQALRIHINGELDALRAALLQSVEALAVDGRLAVISFHSLEDRIVKRCIRDTEALRAVERVFPDDAEAQANPRARSAVLRVARKLSSVVWS